MKDNYPTLLKTTEVSIRKPIVANFFNHSQLGYLFYCGVVRGKKFSRYTFVCLEDVMDCIEQKKKVKRL